MKLTENEKYALLIADDEEGITSLLKDYFTMQGYRILIAGDGIEVMSLLPLKPDLILLDVAMPGMDGFTVCSAIREEVSCPIIFLTAKIEEKDRIRGLSLGGDDYILKPFSIEELGARVAAHLRRERRKKNDGWGSGRDDEEGSGSVKSFGELTIRYGEHVVCYQQVIIDFPKMEFDIIEVLSLNPGQVFGKEQLYQKIKGIDATGDAAIISEHIRRIRNKLLAVTKTQFIETVWGVGYKWIG